MFRCDPRSRTPPGSPKSFSLRRLACKGEKGNTSASESRDQIMKDCKNRTPGSAININIINIINGSF